MKITTRKKEIWRLPASILASCLLFTSVMVNMPAMKTTAAPGVPSGSEPEITYEPEGEGYVYRPKAGNYLKVVVPAGCTYEVNNPVDDDNAPPAQKIITIGEVEIQEGGSFAIYDDSVVTITGKLTIGKGAHLTLASPNCLVMDASATLTAKEGAVLEPSRDAGVPVQFKLTSPDGNPFNQSNLAFGFWENRFVCQSDDGDWLDVAEKGDDPIIEVQIDGLKPVSKFELEYKYTNTSEGYVNEGIWTSDDDKWTQGWKPGDDGVHVAFTDKLSKGFPDLELTLRVYSSNPASPVEIADSAWDEGGPKQKKVFTKNETDLNTGISEIVYQIKGSDISGAGKPEFHFALSYYHQGDKEAPGIIESYLYAYGDLDNDGNVDKTDLQRGLSAELCDKLFWNEGGILDGNFGITNVKELENRITIPDAHETIIAKTTSGTQNLEKYRYTIDLGYDNNGQKAIASGDIYTLPDNSLSYVLIDTGNTSGDRYFLRNLSEDAIDFDGTGAGDRAVCVTAEYVNSKLRLNGNGCVSKERINPENDDVYCVYLSLNGFRDVYESSERGYDQGLTNVDKWAQSDTDPTKASNEIRVIKPSKTYVLVEGSGEPYEVAGINKEQIDNVCQTGTPSEKKYSEVFVGHTKINIRPLSEETGVTVRKIKDVKLKDPTITDGVKVGHTDNTDPNADADDGFVPGGYNTMTVGGEEICTFDVKFYSNVYDSVVLIITYDNNTTTELTIKRIGLVIKYKYLADSNNPAENFELEHGGEKSGVNVTYDYQAGEQIIIWATYYHPTKYQTKKNGNDLVLYLDYGGGKIETKVRYRYTPASGNKVATTDFLIGFCEAKIWNGSVWLPDESNPNKKTEGFNAYVVNGDYDNRTEFNGTQVGSGEGITWDGKIPFIKR